MPPLSRRQVLSAALATVGAAAAALARAAETAPADRAALLASIAACEASHQVLLS